MRSKPWYLGKFDLVDNENQIKAYISEGTVGNCLDRFTEKLKKFGFLYVYSLLNVPRGYPNSDTDALLLYDKKQIPEKILRQKSREILQWTYAHNGKAIVIEVKNITTRFYFSVRNTEKLVYDRFRDADPDHHHLWVLIIPRLKKTCRKVWDLLKAHGIYVLEMGKQLLQDDVSAYKRWIKRLKIRLWYLVEKYFGCTLLARLPPSLLAMNLITTKSNIYMRGHSHIKKCTKLKLHPIFNNLSQVYNMCQGQNLLRVCQLNPKCMHGNLTKAHQNLCSE